MTKPTTNDGRMILVPSPRTVTPKLFFLANALAEASSSTEYIAQKYSAVTGKLKLFKFETSKFC